MRQLTKAQKVVLFLGIAAAVVAVAYPPFISGGDLIPTIDYAPLWQPPIVDPEYGTPTVFYSLLLIEFVVLLVLILIIMGILRPDPDRGQMSNTRWNLLLWNLSDIPIRVRFKCIDGDQEFDGALSPTAKGSVEGPAGPILRQSLEWLEIDPIEQINREGMVTPQMINHADAVIAVLRTLNVPYEWNGTWLRIAGHVPNP